MRFRRLLVTVTFLIITLFVVYPLYGMNVNAGTSGPDISDVYKAYMSIVNEKARGIFCCEIDNNSFYSETRYNTALYDIDGDGIEEFFFIYNDSYKFNGKGILAIYTYKNGRAEKYIDDLELWSENQELKKLQYTILAGSDSDIYIFCQRDDTKTGSAMHLSTSPSRSVICSEIYKYVDYGNSNFIYSKRTTPVEIYNIWDVGNDGFHDDLTKYDYDSAVSNMKNSSNAVLMTTVEESSLPCKDMRKDMPFISLLKRLNFHNENYYPSFNTINEALTEMGFERSNKTYTLGLKASPDCEVYYSTDFVMGAGYGTYGIIDNVNNTYYYHEIKETFTYAETKNNNFIRIWPKRYSGNEGLVADILLKILKPIEDENGYNIIVSDSDHGNIYVDNLKCKADTIVNVSVVPHYGYTLEKLTYSTSEISNINITSAKSFSMPESDVVISATYRKTRFEIDIENSEHGLISVENKYQLPNSVVKVTVAPEAEYELVNLQYTLEDNTVYDITSTKQFNMPEGDITLSATFKVKEYQILINSSSHGTISTENNTYAKGSSVKVTVTPEDGYYLSGLTFKPNNGSEIDITAPKRFTMPSGNVTLKATFTPITYDVNLLVGNNGDATISAEQATKGQTIYVSAYPDDDFMIDSISYTTADGIETDITQTKKFTMPPSDVTVNVTFKPREYPITITSSSYGIVTTAQSAYCSGTLVDVVVNPKTGYRLNKLTYTIDGGSTKELVNNQFEMPKAPVTITAEYIKVYQVELVQSTGGRITTETSYYAKDELVSINVEVYDGYELESITYSINNGSPIDITSDSQFIMPDKKVKISVAFSLVYYDVSISYNEFGTASLSITSTTIGQNVIVTAEANSECSIGSITYTPEGGNPINITNSKCFKMPAKNVRVDVKFLDKQYNFTDFDQHNYDCVRGLIHHTSEKYERNSIVPLGVTLREGIQADKIMFFSINNGELEPLFEIPFSEWKKVDEGYELQFVMPDCDVAACLSLIYDHLNVSLNVGEHGSVNLSYKGSDTNEGDKISPYSEISIETIPDEGYEREMITYSYAGEDGEYTTNKYILVYNKDVTINVSFKAKEYAVTRNSVYYGKISTEKTSYPFNSIVNVTVSPNEGYKLKTLSYSLKDGTSIDITSTRQFVMPNGPVRLSATFELEEYDVPLLCNEFGTASVSATKATMGQKIYVSVTPNDNCELKQIIYTTEDGTVYNITQDKWFRMPAGNVEVSVVFSKKTYTVSFESEGQYYGYDIPSQHVEYGSKVTRPANPGVLWDTYEFDDWYTDRSYSTKYDFSKPVYNSITLYGKYVYIPPEYNITLSYLSSCGYVTYSGTNGSRSGSAITITVTPCSGYEVENILLADYYGNSTYLNILNPEFVMPSNDVKIYVSFVKNDPTPNPTPTPSPISPSSSSSYSFADFVERLYVVALNRQSEKDGKDYWCELVGNGTLTGADAARSFLTSPEFKGRGLSDEEFLKVLYKTFFDRNAEADPDGFNFWLNTLKTQGRDTVVEGFINSPEWCNICATYGVKSGAVRAKATVASKNATAFAERLYTKCLGRDSEASGLNYWSLALTNLEVSGSSAARQFFESPEFKGHNFSNEEYLTRLYRTFMGREPDRAGLDYWLDCMSGGMSRETVFDSFVASKEFTDICKEYGIER